MLLQLHHGKLRSYMQNIRHGIRRRTSHIRRSPKCCLCCRFQQSLWVLVIKMIFLHNLSMTHNFLGITRYCDEDLDYLILSRRLIPKLRMCCYVQILKFKIVRYVCTMLLLLLLLSNFHVIIWKGLWYKIVFSAGWLTFHLFMERIRRISVIFTHAIQMD